VQQILFVISKPQFTQLLNLHSDKLTAIVDRITSLGEKAPNGVQQTKLFLNCLILHVPPQR